MQSMKGSGKLGAHFCSEYSAAKARINHDAEHQDSRRIDFLGICVLLKKILISRLYRSFSHSKLFFCGIIKRERLSNFFREVTDYG